MKKYAILLLFALLLNGCDDGDLTIESINFDDVKPQTCSTDNTLLYLLKNQEAFLLQLPKDNGIINDPKSYSYKIESGGNGTYRLLYRAYDGTVATANICGLIPPSTPKVTEEWVATDGTIQITTAQIPNDEATDGSTKITGYTHSINFTNITFAVPNSKPQTYETFPFGTLSTTANIPATLAFSSELAGRCTNNDLNRIYNYAPSFYIMIENISSDLIVDKVTAGTPRTGLISSTTNKVSYRSVAANTGSLSKDYFCNVSYPTSPSIAEDWTAKDGVDKVSGIIEVVTTEVGGKFFHTITLKNVTMAKGNSVFKLPKNFVLGRLE